MIAGSLCAAGRCNWENCSASSLYSMPIQSAFSIGVLTVAGMVVVVVKGVEVGKEGERTQDRRRALIVPLQRRALSRRDREDSSPFERPAATQHTSLSAAYRSARYVASNYRPIREERGLTSAVLRKNSRLSCPQTKAGRTGREANHAQRSGNHAHGTTFASEPARRTSGSMEKFCPKGNTAGHSPRHSGSNGPRMPCLHSRNTRQHR